jgi:transcriptional regulator with XRE-family HTH domain
VRALRHRAGFTLEQCAERSSLELTHLQKIEAGLVNVTLITLIRLANGLRVDIADFFSSSPPEGGERGRRS